jgi:hypothetical protein
LQGDAQSPLLIRDPQWIQRFTAFLSSVRGTEVAGTFQISTGCAVVLFRGEEAALHTWWADDRHVVLVSNDQRTELEVSKDVFVQFEALCALKRRSRHPEKEPNKSPETNALPGQ